MRGRARKLPPAALALALAAGPWAQEAVRGRAAAPPASPAPSSEDMDLGDMERAWAGLDEEGRARFHVNVTVAAAASSRRTPHEAGFVDRALAAARSARDNIRGNVLDNIQEAWWNFRAPPRPGLAGPGRTGDVHLAPPPVEDGLYCNYGGYFSVMLDGGDGVRRCKPPWKLRPEDLGDLSALHVDYGEAGNTVPGRTGVCGLENFVRCNPIIYGFAKDFHEDYDKNEVDQENRKCKLKNDGLGGCCIEVPDQNHAGDVTAQCNEQLLKEEPRRIRERVRDLAKNPAELAKYLTMALVTINDCRRLATVTEECQALVDMTKHALGVLEDDGRRECFRRELFDLGVDLDHLEQLALYLGDGRLAETFEWAAERRRVLDAFIADFGRDERTRKVMDTAWANKDGVLGRCYAYVKAALAAVNIDEHQEDGTLDRGDTFPRGNRGGYLGEQIGGVDAVDAREGLADHGFVNIVDLGFPLDPERAPPGSVVVYDEPDEPGHVEIVYAGEGCADRCYVSDNSTVDPISARSHVHKPVAIMVPMGNETRRRLGIGTLECVEDRSKNRSGLVYRLDDGTSGGGICL